MSAGLQQHQAALARYWRDPNNVEVPGGADPARISLYQELIFNNIERLVAGVFPVLRSLYELEDWNGLIRAFIDKHRCQTPLFLEISQEFVEFLMSEHQARDCDPTFLTELAHYEWVELALDVSEETLPPATDYVELLDTVPRLSPLAWVLSYQYPVHRIGPGNRPTEAPQATYLAVYRDRQESVQFMELNAATTRLLELLRDNESSSAREIFGVLAAELGMEPDAVLAFGSEQLEQLITLSLVVL